MESITAQKKQPIKPLKGASVPPAYEFRLTPKDLQGKYNLAARPEISGIEDNGDYISLLSEVIIHFHGAQGRPLCEVQILVEGIPSYVADEIHRIADGIILRHMVAECLIENTSS